MVLPVCDFVIPCLALPVTQFTGSPAWKRHVTATKLAIRVHPWFLLSFTSSWAL
ncbi:hypothetical protein BX600DRAFT_451009 [Xylariales sp. PMI_506]|nr:hypothetical protein BX600DRAFT_451009 [Xylariales sp. PMI_506]